jgi:hypothetical protein
MATTSTSLIAPVLYTHYVDLENTLPSGVHVGGAVDIYVNAPSQMALKTGTVVLSNPDKSFALIPENGFTLPIQEIIAVTSNDLEIARGSDWTLTNENLGTSWSNKEQITMNVSETNATVSVTYRYYKEIDALQTHMENDKNRYVGNSNLVKIMPPAVISINTLEYRDGPTIAQAQKLLKDYINGLTDTIEISDIIVLLTDNGATFVDLDSLNINVREYDEFKVLIKDEEITSTYTLPSTKAFYTDELEMTGLIKL